MTQNNNTGVYDTSMAPLTAQSATMNEETTHYCAKVGLCSFSPLDAEACPGFGTDGADEVNPDTFEFPSWDQLPADFQNPTSSADFYSTIPISTAVGSVSDAMAWDNDDMNFAMDMDLDMNMDEALDMIDFGR